MYLKHWQLKRKPFTTAFEPAMVFPRPAFAQAFHFLSLKAKVNPGNVWLVGGPGSGKTTVVRSLADSLRDDVRFKLVKCSRATDAVDLVEQMEQYAAIGAPLRVASAVRTVRRFFIGDPAGDMPLLLVLEDADRLVDPAAIRQCLALCALGKDRLWPLTLLLTGRGIPIPLMPTPEHRMRVMQLPTPDAAQASRIVLHRLSRSGAERQILTEGAVKRLSVRAGGDIGSLLALCDLALRLGFEQKLEKISEQIVAEFVEPIFDQHIEEEERIGAPPAKPDPLPAEILPEELAPEPDAELEMERPLLQAHLRTYRVGALPPLAPLVREAKADAPPEGVVEPQEIEEARKLYDQALEKVRGTLDLLRNKEEAQTEGLRSLAEHFAASISTGPALQSLALSDFEEYGFIHHLVNVAILAVAAGLQINLPEEDLYILGLAGLLHDVGHLHCGEELLKEEHRFDREHFKKIKEHPQIGYELIKQLTDAPELVATIVLQEHERDDGLGYPNYLVGAQIHLLAKIIGVCDVYEALTHRRAHRKALTPAAALAEINSVMGRRFYPRAVTALHRAARPAFR